MAESRQRKIANRDDMGVAISGAGVAPAIAESVELFDVAEGRASLLRDEGPERDLESAMKQGIKFAGGQPTGEPGASGTVRMSGSSSRAATIAAVRPIASGKPVRAE